MGLINKPDPEHCDHAWTVPEYLPTKDFQPTGFETVDARNTVVMRSKGSQLHEVRRWKRECVLCGKVEWSRNQLFNEIL